MGINHPISLRLKKNIYWNSTLYSFNQTTLSGITNQEKNLYDVLNHYFQYVLISKPNLRYEFDKIIVRINYYGPSSYAPSSAGNPERLKKGSTHAARQLGALLEAVRNKNIVGLEKIIPRVCTGSGNFQVEGHVTQTFHNREVQLQLVRLESPILDSYILAQYVAKRLKSHSINTIWRKILKSTSLYNCTSFLHTTALPQRPSACLQWGASGATSGEFHSFTTGVKLIISGRSTKRRGASRTKLKSLAIGSFKFSSAESLIDYGAVMRKDKNGSQTIKVFTSTTIG